MESLELLLLSHESMFWSKFCHIELYLKAAIKKHPKSMYLVIFVLVVMMSFQLL